MIQEDYGPYLAQSVEQELALRLTKEDQEEVPADPAVVDDHPIDRFSDLVAWVIRNLHADLSVEVLARRACMCPDHFSKVFKSVFGEPPSNFVQNLRLNEARRRLAGRRKNAPHRCRFSWIRERRFVSSRIRAKVWDATGPVPGEWKIGNSSWVERGRSG